MHLKKRTHARTAIPGQATMSQAQPSIPSTPMAGSSGATTPINEKGDAHSTKDEREASILDVTQLPELENESGIRTPAQRRKAFMQFAALCCSIFVAGWNDGTLGPLLPRLQEVYHVSLLSCRILMRRL